jgi:hypothetical protein
MSESFAVELAPPRPWKQIGVLVWRRILAAAFADLIVGMVSFNAGAAICLMWVSIIASSILWGLTSATLAIFAFWPIFAGPYTYLLVTLTRAAWKLPKMLWRAVE